MLVGKSHAKKNPNFKHEVRNSYTFLSHSIRDVNLIVLSLMVPICEQLIIQVQVL